MGHLDDICSTIYNLQKGLHATYTKEKARLNWWKMSRNSVGHILAFKYSQITCYYWKCNEQSCYVQILLRYPTHITKASTPIGPQFNLPFYLFSR